MIKAKKFVVKKYFQGVPKKDDFEIVEYELPTLKDGEILVKTEWISVDPYARAYNKSNPVPYDQFSYQVGLVQDSKDPNYPLGCRIVTYKGWCDYSIVKDQEFSSLGETIYKLPDLKGFSPSHGIGAVGMSGITAYCGFLDICKPKAGETVVVTGAAGAVGSLVGQIAKIKDCTVIGFTGSDDKVKWLEEELGFDKGINYKTENVHEALKTAAPKGVDCYFDNVGGELSSIIINQMNLRGRVSVCGSISSYNEDPADPAKATLLQPALVFNRLKIEGFLTWDYKHRWEETLVQLIEWIYTGKLKAKEHVTVGFEKLFDAFNDMLAGENYGKALVKV